MNYSQTLAYLETFVNYEKLRSYPYKDSLKLKRVSDFLELIGSPQLSLKCLHIAGTKGKGSTSAFIAYILREGGYRTGLYTSPHLSSFRERIRILEPGEGLKSEEDFPGMISESELAEIVTRLKPEIGRYNKTSSLGPLSFFEVYTAAAFLYFKEKDVDYAVLETGLGGRLDATNTVVSLVSVITPISLEHTQKLGDTLEEIAGEKAGIIKPGQPVISAPQEEEARRVIVKRCRELGARLYEAGKDIVWEKNGRGFELRGINSSYRRLDIRLAGDHQLDNASAAVGAVEALSGLGAKISPEAISRGLYNTFWPGRCEAVSREPLVILDGAQNPASCRALKDAVKKYFKYKNIIMVLGISADKDIKGVCSELSGIADAVILTRSNNPRAVSTQELREYFAGREIYETAGVKEAKEKALLLYRKGDMILVCGSLFVAGEFRDEIKKRC